MSNIIDFRSPRFESQPDQAAAEQRPRDFSEAKNRAAELQSKAKKAVEHAILLLDLAMEQARQIASYMPDQLSKERLEAQIGIIEALLQIARDKAVRLEPFAMAPAVRPVRCAEPAPGPGGVDPVVRAHFRLRTFHSGDLP